MTCECERMAKVEKTLFGNSGNGLEKMVKNHEKIINRLEGMIRLLKILLILLGIPAAKVVADTAIKIFK